MHCLVVDDEYQPRGATMYALGRIAPSIVVSEAESLAEAIQKLEASDDVELIILDLNLSGESLGIDTLKTLNRWRETRKDPPRVVVVSAAGDHDISLVIQVLEHDGTGFIYKNTPHKIFQSALQLTISGGVYIPREVLRGFRLPPPVLPRDNGGVHLTDREKEVARMLKKGWPYKRIAIDLEIAPATVRSHVINIASKLKVPETVSPKAGVMARLSELPPDFLG